MIIVFSLLSLSCKEKNDKFGYADNVLDYKIVDTNEQVNYLLGGLVLSECETVSINNCLFDLCYNDNKDRIISIICKDKLYSTVEGIRVGSSLQEIKGVTNNIVTSKDGWKNVIEIPISKWSAVFDSRIKTSDSSKVKFLYYEPI
ncbi:hypothetical protein [Winogradskyella sp. 4-2091]|uniref:hypothetical protein n=1 Tax=Winogradskyella sp. 4-2091 TaxID=3381659 RepID=UPI0038917016